MLKRIINKIKYHLIKEIVLVDSENLSALPRDTVSPHHEVALQLGYDSHEKKQHLQVLAMMPRKAHKNLR
jgi:hypothetical protein